MQGPVPRSAQRDGCAVASHVDEALLVNERDRSACGQWLTTNGAVGSSGHHTLHARDPDLGTPSSTASAPKVTETRPTRLASDRRPSGGDIVATVREVQRLCRVARLKRVRL